MQIEAALPLIMNSLSYALSVSHSTLVLRQYQISEQIPTAHNLTLFRL
jgi:hypothetical protein